MNIVEQQVVNITPLPYVDMVHIVSKCARTCYDSQNKVISFGGEEKFIQGLIKVGHESVIEPITMSVEMITSRSTQNQLVRHRHASFGVMSQRYCNYHNEEKYPDGVAFIRPKGLKNESTWRQAVQATESAYMALIESGEPPEVARAVLPQCTATQMFMSANIREWRHIFKLRCDKRAQSDVRELMQELLTIFKEEYPCFFKDLY